MKRLVGLSFCVPVLVAATFILGAIVGGAWLQPATAQGASQILETFGVTMA